MADLYPLPDKCPKCGTGHMASPCRHPCICKCRKCDAPLSHKNMPLEKDCYAGLITTSALGRSTSPNGDLILCNAAPGQWACSPAPI